MPQLFADSREAVMKMTADHADMVAKPELNLTGEKHG
jgi:hypothetical protein